MTGIEYFNFPAFDKARDMLRLLGHEVFNPADHDRSLLGKNTAWLPTLSDSDGTWKYWSIPNAPDLRTMLGADLAWIAKEAEGIFMLNNWENSKGANAEWALAKALGLKIMYEGKELEIQDHKKIANTYFVNFKQRNSA